MKKIFLITTLFFTALAIKAQYFHHIYGTPDGEFLHSGVNTSAQGQGHFMAGTSTDPSGSTNYLTAVFTDIDGNVPGAPYFENNYTLISGGTILSVSDAHAFETGNGFGVVGMYNDPAGGFPSSGIYYLKLDGSGNPLSVQEYTPVAAAFTWTVGTVGGICKSSTGNELYITGGVVTTNGNTHILALKIDINSGGILWSNIYEITHYANNSREIGKAVVENPATSELIIAGIARDQLPVSTIDGFILKVDANTGNVPNPWAQVFGSRYDDDHFTSITLSNSSAGGGTGYVLGGIYNNGTDMDAWLMKTDQTCTTALWSNLFDYSQNTGTSNTCLSVMERFNGSYTYYMGGSADQGVFGFSDALVIKTDDLGNGLPNGEFTYGSAGWEQCTQLDQFNNTAADGLSVYANSSSFANSGLGGGDFYLVKSYFDGNSGCNESFSTPVSTPGPGLLAHIPVQTHSVFASSSLLVQTTNISDFQLCYTPVITGATNARVAPEAPKGDKQAILSPNPVTQGAALATIEVSSETKTTVDITIYDMLGKQYYAGNFTLIKGNNQLPVDISTTGMSAGMYTVKISGENINNTILLIVK